MARLKHCELRIIVTSEEGKNLVCGAAGLPLGDSAEEICQTCRIPEIVNGDPWACLHLRPVRLTLDGTEPPYFSCRWFYNLRPERQPTDLLWCHHCPYWFPKPPVSLIPNYWSETERIRDTISRALENAHHRTNADSPPHATDASPILDKARDHLWKRLRSLLPLRGYRTQSSI